MTSKEIRINRGYVILLDEDDFKKFSKFTWTASVRGDRVYARRHVPKTRKKKYLHREILGVEDSRTHVDHINGNSLDNRKANLRKASPGQNAKNRIGRPGRKYKGITKTKSGKWAAQITADYRHINLGVFETPESAYAAYDAAAQKYHGEFAKLNNLELTIGT